MNIQILVDGVPLLHDFTPIDALFPRINGVEHLFSSLNVAEKDEFILFEIAGNVEYIIRPDQKLTFEFKPGA